MSAPSPRPSTRTGVAILGSGNIGTDLLAKLRRADGELHVVAMVGVDPASDGIARARDAGVRVFSDGLDGLMRSDCWDDVAIVFDATSAYAHKAHAPVLEREGRVAIDLTPAAVGPGLVPVVNPEALGTHTNVNLVTCGGQATLPIVHALSRVAPVYWAEIVAAIASRSAGPGTRANIDEFTQTTARAVETIGGATHGKAIILLNPADPPITMRDTVHALVADCDPAELTRSVEAIVKDVQEYVPGYRLRNAPDIEDRRTNGVRLPDGTVFRGWRVTVLLEVTGNGDYLPPWAGNLDIMTAAAVRTGQLAAARRSGRTGGDA
jgi:acetaldehyde dehydrogenase